MLATVVLILVGIIAAFWLLGFSIAVWQGLDETTRDNMQGRFAFVVLLIVAAVAAMLLL